MEPSRVVEVYCAAGGVAGTGYLTTAGTVLTAWHVVEAAGPGGVVEFRPLVVGGPAGRWFQATVAWPVLAALPCAVDVALLAVDDPAWPGRDVTPLRWGQIAGQGEVPVIGLGFPDAAKDRTPGSGARDTLPLRGSIDPLAHAKSSTGHVVVGLTGPLVPASGRQGSSPWSGASGTALFSAGTDILLAVTTTDHELAIDARTLTATPVTALAVVPGFAAVAAAHGIAVEPVEVAGDLAEHSRVSLPPVSQVPVPVGLSNLGAGQVFVGRVAELEDLRAAMGSGSGVVSQVIVGLGGIGKTALAAEYARRSAGDYAAVWSLTADSRANVDGGLAGLARRLCPTTASGHDEAALAQWALSWLQGHPGWLLIWDNVDELEEVLALLASLASGHHLVTSRRSGGWHRIGVAAPMRLGELTPDDAVALLTGLAGLVLAGNAAVAGQLCAELGFLPLAVEQAGAYLAEAGITAAVYLDRWRTANALVVGKASESLPSDRIITVVWRITLDRLRSTPLAGRLLRVMAWLAPDGIPRELLAPLAEDPDALEAALARLNAYSMVALDPAGGTVGIHRVVQAVARTPDAEDEHRRPEEVAAGQSTAIGLLAALIPSTSDPGHDAVTRWRVLLPHVDAFAAHTAGRPVPPDAIGVMDQAFGFLLEQGNVAAATRIAACSLAGDLEHHGPDHPNTLTSRNNLAGAYESAGDLGKAVPLFEQTLADRIRVLGEDHPSTLSSRNNLASAYESAGDLRKAIPLYEQTLADRIRVQGENHPDTLTSRNNLAHANESAGDLGKAVPLFEQTLADRIRVLGEDHPSTLGSRNNLAYAYESAGDLGKAIPLFEQTLADRIRVLGEDHPSTLGSRNDLAYAYEVVGDLGKAIPLFEQTLADRIRVLGEDHPDTLASRNNLARVYVAVGDLGKAIPLFEQTLADCVRVLGEDHPDTLDSRNNLANAYEVVGDLGKAIPLSEQALADRVRVLGEDHPDTLDSRNNLAYAYAAAGDLGKAIPLYEQTLTDRIRVQGEDHPSTLTSRNNLAGVYVAVGDLGKAIPLHQQVLADSVRVLGEDHPDTLGSRNNLADAYESAGDLGKAIPLFEQSLADYVRVLGEDHPFTLTSRNNLAHAYESARDLGKAIPLYQQVLADSVRVLGEDHPTTAVVRGNLARAIAERGTLDTAQATGDET